MITIVDYGAGNLRSVQNTLERSARDYEVVNATAEDCRRASKIILPGVGHFGQMMRALDRLDVARRFARTNRARRSVSGHLSWPAVPI